MTVRKTSTVEVGELLELCSRPWKICKHWLQKLFNKNNYPLVQIHCIIKIMFQGLPLGWLDCLFGLCSAKIETLAVVHEFSFFTGMLNDSETFCIVRLYKFFIFLIFQYFWSYKSMIKVQIATDSSVFDKFCFRCIVCLFWWIYGLYWRV